MTLVDTSVWVTDFRAGNARFTERLRQGQLLSHPFAIGELACEDVTKRQEILALPDAFPRAAMAEHREVMALLKSSQNHPICMVADLVGSISISSPLLFSLAAISEPRTGPSSTPPRR